MFIIKSLLNSYNKGYVLSSVTFVKVNQPENHFFDKNQQNGNRK